MCLTLKEVTLHPRVSICKVAFETQCRGKERRSPPSGSGFREPQVFSWTYRGAWLTSLLSVYVCICLAEHWRKINHFLFLPRFQIAFSISGATSPAMNFSDLVWENPAPEFQRNLSEDYQGRQNMKQRCWPQPPDEMGPSSPRDASSSGSCSSCRGTEAVRACALMDLPFDFSGCLHCLGNEAVEPIKSIFWGWPVLHLGRSKRADWRKETPQSSYEFLWFQV